MTSFIWEGTPVPKARPRMNTKTGAVYTPKTTQEFEAAMGWAYREAGGKSHQGDVTLYVTVHEPPGHPADLDNYIKAVSDALNGLAFGDDKQVTRIIGVVHRGSEGGAVEVEVTSA